MPASIRFEDVRFRYRRGHRLALDGLSFDVAPGETVAIVGPSGAGKTTITSLLLRFFDPTDGRILLGGVPLSDLEPEEAQSLFALVPQDTFLFHDSVRSNLALADPGAGDERVADAARAAGAPRSSRGCRTGTTRSWASAGSSCPAASASAWRSRAPC